MGATVRAEDVLTTGDGSRGLYVKRSDPSDRVFPVEKVARVDLDGYQARQSAVFAGEAHTARVAEATLQDRLGPSSRSSPRRGARRASVGGRLG